MSKEKKPNSRRRFLSGALTSLAIPVVGVAAQSNYSAGSIAAGDTEIQSIPQNNSLKLSLARADIPISAWGTLSEVGKVWDDLLFNKFARAEFFRDKNAYLSARGVDPKLISADDSNIHLLNAIIDPEINQYAMNSDYEGFIFKLTNLGVLSNRDSNGIQKALEKILAEDNRIIEEFKKNNMNMDLSKLDLNNFAESDEFESLRSILLGESFEGIQDLSETSYSIFLVAGIVVAIAVFVVAYVSVGTTATLALMLGAFISVAVSTVVVASETPEPPEVEESIRNGTNKEQVIKPKIPNEIKTLNMLLDLDVDYKLQTERALRLAALLGNDHIVKVGTMKTTKEILSSIFLALENVGLIKLGDNLKPAINAAHLYVEKVVFNTKTN